MAYTNAFIHVSEDTRAETATVPLERGGRVTLAGIEHQLLISAPYTLDHLEFTYTVYAKSSLAKGVKPESAEQYHAKGRPCMRASALVKSYGWGAHYNGNGKIALVPLGSPQYEELSGPDNGLRHLKGMRSSRA